MAALPAAGGRVNSPIDARFIPPPEGEVERLIEDLVTFVNRDDLPAVAQAAIAHAQFETAGRISDWCASFAGGCTLAADLALDLAGSIRWLQAEWIERAGRPRADSAAARIIRLLADAGVIRQISEGAMTDSTPQTSFSR